MKLRFPAWVWLMASLLLVVSSVPYAYGWFKKPADGTYFGVQTNFDDQAVYAAWIKQAQEGRFFFENRFTTEEQPRQTIHFYFFALGNLAKVTGIPLAMHIGRLLFSILFVFSLYKLVKKITDIEAEQKWALFGSVFFAGLGWLAWSNYGHSGPIDVWQPEAFAFPATMTNGLFAVSLFLIVAVWNSILDSKESWKAVLPGAVALLALTNIHTYDTLLIALVSIPFLLAMMFLKQVSASWLIRSLVIASGAIPSLLWFLHVRSIDTVFAARAATETYSPPVIQVWSSIALIFAIAMICLVLKKQRSPAMVLVGVWAVVAPWIIYYPGLFQRKLSMAMGLPIGLLSGLGIAILLSRVDSRVIRLACGACLAVVLSLSSIRWIIREAIMVDINLSNTTVHSICADKDVSQILNYLMSNKKDSDVLIAMPGIPNPQGEDQFALGIPDLNAVMTGWAGIKTYAGHWSETPNYLDKRNEVTRTLYASSATQETADKILTSSNANFVIMPNGAIQSMLGTKGGEILWRGAEPVVRTENWILFKKP